MIAGLDAGSGLRNMRGDVAGYLRLLRQLDTTHGDDMQKLQAHLAKNEFEEAGHIAHTLKGASGTLGLKTLQLAAAALENDLAEHSTGQDSNDLSSRIDAISTEQKHFRQALARIMETDTENTVEADPVAAQKVIKRMVKLLEKDDVAVNALYLENEKLLKSTFGTTAEQLGQQIEAFDYLLALKTITTL